MKALILSQGGGLHSCIQSATYKCLVDRVHCKVGEAGKKGGSGKRKEKGGWKDPPFCQVLPHFFAHFATQLLEKLVYAVSPGIMSLHSRWLCYSVNEMP